MNERPCAKCGKPIDPETAQFTRTWDAEAVVEVGGDLLSVPPLEVRAYHPECAPRATVDEFLSGTADA